MWEWRVGELGEGMFGDVGWCFGSCVCGRWGESGRMRYGTTRRILDGSLGIPAEEINETAASGFLVLIDCCDESEMRNEVWE
jgi:hypothetical protein